MLKVLTASLALAVPVSGAKPPPAHAACTKRLNAWMVRRAIDVAYHGTRDVTALDRSHLRHYVRCMRRPDRRPAMHLYWHNARAAWKLRRNPPLNGPVVASWFDDSGATGCGFHATYGFATLNGIPCGATITMRGPSGVLVRATREDSGPYVGGRTFDLNPSLKQALGCSDLCEVYWR